MTPPELSTIELENFARLQRIKKDNGNQENPTLDYEIQLSIAKLSSYGVNVENLELK